MNIRLSDDKAELQVDVIHGFLSTSYWAEGIPRRIVEASIAGSMCLGAYRSGDGAQVGFARLITDRATFAWLADVFVLPEARGLGVSKAMLAWFDCHPDLQELRRWMLATKDAHRLYEQAGYERITDASRLMGRFAGDGLYQRIAK